MAHAIQPLRRSILSKTQNLLQFLQIQHHHQNPNSIFTPFHIPHSSIQPQPRNYGSMVSEMRKSAFENNMLRLLRNEIQRELDDSPVQQPPAQCNGFKVEERPGERWISLSKKFGRSEEISVEVTMFDGSVPVPKDGDKPGQPGEDVHLHITMIISISKEESNRVLEFICSAWPDTIDVKQLFVREQSKLPNKPPYTGPLFEDLDDEMQESIYNFLEERGIDDNLCTYLHNYIHYKDQAEFIRWMESVRKTIENK
ncbi:hypothetical protein RND81_09G130900 [Saponaria officinalis]|uniref:Mitochondrial glycoprotein n=1 Tax=Saponaria officinalis TaxID=3572 RepID=A0AAW1ILV9_SAPOF